MNTSTNTDAVLAKSELSRIVLNTCGMIQGYQVGKGRPHLVMMRFEVTQESTDVFIVRALSGDNLGYIPQLGYKTIDQDTFERLKSSNNVRCWNNFAELFTFDAHSESRDE